MKGIILAGGNGTRLQPLTLVGSKQLAPVYDKPMVYYPLSVLMLTGIDDVLIIARPAELVLFRKLFGDGSRLGMRIDYAAQEEPRGVADAFIVGASHIAGEECALILGDNLFHGAKLPSMLRETVRKLRGCVLFGHQVTEPQHSASPRSTRRAGLSPSRRNRSSRAPTSRSPACTSSTTR